MTPNSMLRSPYTRYALGIVGSVLGFFTITWLVYGLPTLPAPQKPLVTTKPLQHQQNCPSEAKRVAVIGKERSQGHYSSVS